MTTTTTQPEHTLLQDHVDARPVAAETDAADRNTIVQLDPDHPGFRDEEYRARRNRIAQIALGYEPGAPVPEAPYSEEEHALWRTIREALEPAHRAHACAEYLEAARRLDLPREEIPQLSEVSERVSLTARPKRRLSSASRGLASVRACPRTS